MTNNQLQFAFLLKRIGVDPKIALLPVVADALKAIPQTLAAVETAAGNKELGDQVGTALLAFIVGNAIAYSAAQRKVTLKGELDRVGFIIELAAAARYEEDGGDAQRT